MLYSRPAGAAHRGASIDRWLAERRAASPEEDAAAATGLDEDAERQVLEGFMTDRMRGWLDDPHPQLDGLTPRQAASGPRRAEVVRLVRGIENDATRLATDETGSRCAPSGWSWGRSAGARVRRAFTRAG